MVPAGHRPKREALSIRLEDMEAEEAVNQRTMAEAQEARNRFEGLVEDDHQDADEGEFDPSTGAPRRNRLDRSISSRASRLSGDSDSEDAEDPNDEPSQSFRQQFLHPQLGAFKSHRLLQQRSHAKEDTARLDTPP